MTRLFVAVVAVYLCGGHWTILQSVAWLNMAVSFSRTDSLQVALEKTFDGAHPCKLCKTVSEGQAKEKKQELAKPVVKLDAILASPSAVPAPRLLCSAAYFVDNASMSGRAYAPVTPPPRMA